MYMTRFLFQREVTTSCKWRKQNATGLFRLLYIRRCAFCRNWGLFYPRLMITIYFMSCQWSVGVGCIRYGTCVETRTLNAVKFLLELTQQTVSPHPPTRLLPLPVPRIVSNFPLCQQSGETRHTYSRQWSARQARRARCRGRRSRRGRSGGKLTTALLVPIV